MIFVLRLLDEPDMVITASYKWVSGVGYVGYSNVDRCEHRGGLVIEEIRLVAQILHLVDSK